MVADPNEELVELVDASGAVVEVVRRAEMRRRGATARHRCTYVAVLTTDGRLVVHRRAEHKDVYPGWWDVAFGGVCGVGETWAEAAARELAEEAGISGVALSPVGQVLWEASDAALLGRVFLARTDAQPTCPDGEVVEVDAIALSDLPAWLHGRPVCTDSREAVLPLLLDHLGHRRTSTAGQARDLKTT